MNKFYKKVLSKLELEISELEVEVDCSLQRIEDDIDIILKHNNLEVQKKSADNFIHFLFDYFIAYFLKPKYKIVHS